MTFAFTAQKTMYGGKLIAEGDEVFVFASENEGGQGHHRARHLSLGRSDREEARYRPADAARESGRMAAFAEICISLACEKRLLLCHLFDSDAGPTHEGVELPSSCDRALRLDHNGRLDVVGSGDAATRGVGDGGGGNRRFWFVEQDSDESRTVP